MAKEKLYAGAKLRNLRRRLSLTQKEFAAKLDVSLPYLNQMENNNRPISAGVLLGLVENFGFDVAELSSSDSARLASDLKEIAADPVFSEDPPPVSDLHLVASNAPGLAKSFLDLHAAYRQTRERLASLDEALGRDDSRMQASPWEEVRDFFHYTNNYIDAVDRAAERFSGASVDTAIETALEKLGVTIHRTDTSRIRDYDPDRKILSFPTSINDSTMRFQMLVQIALLTQNDLLEATLDFAKFQSEGARNIAKMGMANYFAGAALLPYQAFAQAAQETRHDLQTLSNQFSASIEQIGHRLSTLQRPGALGIPFFFVRVDQAGTITKRHSATALQFARYGGACPLWNVHAAFETPGQFIRQLAETPDGRRYFCLATDITKPASAWGQPVRRFAMGLGCEIKHANDLVYADGLEIETASAFEPIGISCRICERQKCHQRSVPPLERHLKIDPNSRGVLPYQVGD